ncbi:hypothetical protein GQ600_13754 [Phytophthora cactorum]|nr:hypothetical protein GQ600_13754 [Phytophthora cactorum]
MGRELVQVAEQRVEETAMDEATRDVDMESMANSSYVGSSPPSQTPPIGATPGSDVPFSLASISSDLLSYKLAQRSQDDSNGDSLAGSSPTEQDQGFSYEMTVGSTSNQNFGSRGFREKRCSAYAHHYALMVANLKGDCSLRIVDPMTELGRLYPECPLPTTTAMAMAGLSSHLLQECARTVDARVPSTHWTNPHFLRAPVQYFWQPILAIDVTVHGDGHTQLCSYHDYDLESRGDGEQRTHQTGSYTALTDDETSQYLQRSTGIMFF